MITLGICLNTETLAPSQYAGFNFNSACVFNSKVLLAGDSGIFTHDGTSDNGTVITSYFQLASASGESSQQKRFRKMYVGGYFAGAFSITVVTDENEGTVVLTKNYDADNRTLDISLSATDKGEFVAIKFANVEGSDFSVDFVQAVLISTVLQPKTPICLGRAKIAWSDMVVSASGA